MECPSLWLNFFSLFYIENVGTCFKYFYDHTDNNYSFHWHHVQFNLPSIIGYDTSLPRVQIIRFDGEVSVRFFILYGNILAYGLLAEHVRYGLRQFFAGLKFIRNQEAVRKLTARGKQPKAA